MKKIFIILLVFITSLLIYNNEKENSIIIPDTSIRLRVVPNSNSSFDQNMKSKVKEYLENNTYTLIKEHNDIDEVRKIINENIPNIKENVIKIFNDNNYDMDFDINYGYNFFPKKEYRGIKYNEGYYESIVISIGEAKGDNWWCVLFPNLCLVDLEQHGDTEYKIWLVEAINKIF